MQCPGVIKYLEFAFTCSDAPTAVPSTLNRTGDLPVKGAEPGTAGKMAIALLHLL